MSTTAAQHKAIYRRLSLLDRRFSRRGISTNRRRTLWAALEDHDPVFGEILQDCSADLQEALSADLSECRRIRAVASEHADDWCASSVYEALLAFPFYLPPVDDFVFRGHLDARWRLIPSFFRRQPPTSLM